MKISELITQLRLTQQAHGDIEALLLDPLEEQGNGKGSAWTTKMGVKVVPHESGSSICLIMAHADRASFMKPDGSTDENPIVTDTRKGGH